MTCSCILSRKDPGYIHGCHRGLQQVGLVAKGRRSKAIRAVREAVETLDEMMAQDMAPLRIGAEHALMACENGALWEKARS